MQLFTHPYMRQPLHRAAESIHAGTYIWLGHLHVDLLSAVFSMAYKISVLFGIRQIICVLLRYGVKTKQKTQ